MQKLGWSGKVWQFLEISPASLLLGCRGAILQRYKTLLLASIIFSPFTGSQCPVLAQSNLVPDNTLGSESSRVIFNFDGTPNEVIGGGAQRGQNLFHSFRELNVGENRGAYFLVFDPNIQNILARVTGSNRSDILGILGTIQVIDGNFFRSNANLFLMNPNGIVFGENARLDVDASFVATTANGIQFGAQGNFSATNPQTPGVLTVNPSALFFNQINQNAAIQNNASLSVPEGKSLLLVGGNVNINGKVLFAPGGRVELGGLTEKGNIEIQTDGNIFSLTFPSQVQRGNLSLNNSAQINVVSAEGGSIAFNSRNINILAGSQILAGSNDSLNTREIVAGDINLNATEAIKVEQNSFIGNFVASAKGGDININANTFSIFGSIVSAITFGEGNGGNLTINIQDFLMGDGARVSADTFSIGNSGNLNVNASNSVKVIGVTGNNIRSTLASQAVEGSDGNAGTLTINTKDLFVQDGAQISAGTFAAGNGGQLTINASNSVQVLGSSGLFAAAEKNSTGNSGNLTITTKTLLLSDNARVSVAMRGVGKAGNLNINAQNLLVNNGGQISAGLFGSGSGGNLIVNAEEVQLIGRSDDGRFGSGLFTSADPDSIGSAGDLTINTQNLLVRDGALIGADTFGRGNGGNLTVNASGKVELIGTSDDGRFGSGLFAQQKETGGIGNAGNLKVNTQNLIVRDGAQVSTATFGAGRGGNLTINASGKVQLIGRSSDNSSPSGLNSAAAQGSTGDAGDLTINAQDLFIRDGAEVITATRGAGNGGNLTINAPGKVELIGRSTENIYGSALRTSVGPSAKGNAGNLIINTNDLFVRNGSQISVGVLGAGKGGNLIVNAMRKVEITEESTNNFFSSGLFGQTEPGTTGDAGDLTINTPELLIENGAGISVQSFGTGNAGILNINAASIRLNNNALITANTRSVNKTPNREQATINLNTENLLLRRNSNITTNAQGENVIGGNININTQSLIALENSDISANSTDFRGGRVSITARTIFGTQARNTRTSESDITATGATPELIGTTEVNTPDNSSIQNNLGKLPQTAIDTNALIANSCIARRNQQQNGSFFITGSGGVAVRPGDAPLPSYSTGDVQPIPAESTTLPTQTRPWQIGDRVVEPTGVYELPNGKLVLGKEC
ncbi:filamentous hemagglutinin N-terminal domain-containing protein [Tolypothrix sp. PCC 7601]|uniref:two-partner secretion domain-containing protein n=1 Tax=Tolypothrix sp. PCC 7601 TaxID=1188 RepID=UPI000693C2E9|nr:filamentous hemagglutinin N-terminal domain-containing protein [Tolypothrix sp. PCC 7601]BAY88995.1 filamentous hemagglutinin outer membrane protein [Microchaete diplosiphon NIES-3275]